MQDVQSVALFLDVENLSIHAQQQGLEFGVDAILRRAREVGRVAVFRAYGDFSKPYMRRVLEDLQQQVFELGQLPTDLKGKNTADMQLALDALEMCLQSSPPSVVIIGSGDRDYVPLAQKLRRYGIHMVGVGLKGSISRSLERVCDEYWYYDDLMPAPALPAITAETADPVDRAIRTLLCAMEDLADDGKTVQGGTLKPAMLKIDPALDLRALGFASFQDFVEEAERRGAVRLVRKGMEFVVLPGSVEDHRGAEPADETPAERTDRLARRYREVLDHKKVPLLPWNDRKRLVTQLWKELTASAEGMTISAMSASLRTQAAMLGIPVEDKAIFKITYTLNLGRCFRVGDQVRFIDDIFNDPAWAACESVDEALDRMHTTYVRGVVIDEPGLPLEPSPIARLLFDTPTETQVEMACEYIRKARGWREE